MFFMLLFIYLHIPQVFLEDLLVELVEKFCFYKVWIAWDVTYLSLTVLSNVVGFQILCSEIHWKFTQATLSLHDTDGGRDSFVRLGLRVMVSCWTFINLYHSLVELSQLSFHLSTLVSNLFTLWCLFQTYPPSLLSLPGINPNKSPIKSNLILVFVLVEYRLDCGIYIS